jgi:hypothetical protein
MRVGRIVAGMAAALAVTGLGIAGATPASATLFTCATMNGVWEDVTNDPAGVASYVTSATFTAGDPLTVTWSRIEGTATGSVLQVPTSRQVALGEPTATLSYTVPIEYAGTQEFTARLSGSITSARITITCGETSSNASGDSEIPAWVQAYGIFHHDDACLTGWRNSWQHWAEPITGGWVCTRTIPSLG